ncbi:hypothetical protein HYH03_007258 [Edaphochlamys debaryana]|uniref:MYND-type domain-containing protein n=1 Tax=Edaphochlamys debaryana TaxID=47281 RepID=A0A835Y3D9_9CHLO|nr:hypothetical protein HYH03_007258 [Edaphochlamys debaryana]|eukprot:KAG2494489.1 hypothetical protein HYH03_007258 [Edaphochlamys debaryana]
MLCFTISPLCLQQPADLAAWSEVHARGRSLTSPEFLTVLAKTVRGAARLAAFLATEQAPRRRWCADNMLTCSASFFGYAASLAQHVLFMMQMHPEFKAPAPRRTLANLNFSGRPLPAPVSQLLAALTSSKLLPASSQSAAAGAAAGAVGEPAQTASREGNTIAHLQAAAAGHLARAIASAMWTGCHVEAITGAEARGQRHALTRQLADPAVSAFCLAQLESLAAHGGVEPAAEGGGGEGRRWSLPRLETAQGRVLAPNGVEVAEQTTEATAAALEQQHCQWLYVSLGLWREHHTTTLVCPPPPGPGTPDAARLAKLAARAGEALCRLYRGQGLGGAYSGARSWQLARTPTLTGLFNPLIEDVTPETLPDWLEAGAWGLAVAVEAVEAVAAELEGRERAPLPASAPLNPSQARGARSGHSADAGRAGVSVTGPSGPGRPHPRTPRGRPHPRTRRAGLAASADHALRPALTAADLAAADPGCPELQQTAEQSLLCVRLVHTLLEHAPFSMIPEQLPPPPKLPPTTTTTPGASAVEPPPPQQQPTTTPAAPVAAAAAAEPEAEAARLHYCGSAAGVLLTLAKRGSAMAARLASLAAAQGPLARRQEEAARKAADVLMGLAEGTLQLLQQLAAAEDDFAAVGHSDTGSRTRVGASAGWGPTTARPAPARAGPAGEEHERARELLAFALRAMCGLATVTAAAFAKGRCCGADAQGRALVRADRGLVQALGTCAMALSIAAVRPGLVRAARPDAGLPAAPPAGGGLQAAVRPAAPTGGARTSYGGDTCFWLASSLATALPFTGAAGAVGAAETAGGGAGVAGAGGGGGGSGAGPAEPPLRGCLERLMGVGLVPLHLASCRDSYALETGCLLALLHSARAGAAGGIASAEQAFKTVARSLPSWVASGGLSAPPVLPDGSSLQALIDRHLDERREPRRSGAADGAAALALATAPLPPPLAVPPAARALRRLRVCGFPAGCGSFGGRCEAELPLKLCGGCRSVRYCDGRKCQRGHWRGTHEHECGAMAAARAAGASSG